jgi:phosphoribosylformylglycinamidine synthase
VNLAHDKLNADAILHLIKNNVAGCVHDCSKGGLAIALAEMAIQADIGVTVELNHIPNSCSRLDNLLFSESHSRFIFGTNRPGEVSGMLEKFNELCIAEIGKADTRSRKVIFKNVNKDPLTQNPDFSSVPAEEIIVVDIPLERLAKSTNVMENIMS